MRSFIKSLNDATAETLGIYCSGCGDIVAARLTDGAEVYPHRTDLHDLPFWVCDACKNYVGCHHKTKNRTRPLGVISTPELRDARRHIHSALDPLWKEGFMERKSTYKYLSKALGREYHTGELKDID